MKDPTGGPLDGLPTIRPRGLGARSYTPDFESELGKDESLGNIRKNNHLTGFSANTRTERLGRIRNQSGRHLGDTFVGLKALGSSAAAGRGSEESHG